MEPRNWIEKAIGTQWLWPPVLCGYINGRPYYTIDWGNGDSDEYYIDFNSHIIEPVRR